MPVDTSTYNRMPVVAPNFESYHQPETPSALDTVGKLQGLQRQDLAISSDKLDLALKQIHSISNEVGSLIGEDVDKKTVTDKLNEYAKRVGLAPEQIEMMNRELTSIPDDKKGLQEGLKYIFKRNLTIAEKLNNMKGTGQAGPTVNTGQVQQPTVTNQLEGTFAKPTGPGFQNQIPPNQPNVYGEDNQPRFQGVQPVPLAPPGRLPTGPVGPGVQGQSSNFGGNVTGATVENSRLPAITPGAPTGPKAGPTPLFEEGKKKLTADQELATTKLTQIKPALQALPYLKDLRSGPGTEGWNKGVAFLKANGIIPIDTKDDKTAIYQEVSKKLHQYVSTNPLGQRSDSALTLAEAASPSPKTQINPALIKLTKDAIVLDRVQAARAGAFQGTNYEKYGQHASTFPASVDERAFGLDLMDDKERNDLLDSMFKKKTTFEGQKFWKSYKIVKDQGLIDIGNTQ